MTSIVSWVFIGLGALIALGWLVAWVRSIWPSAVPDSVADVVDTVSDYADEATAVLALKTLSLLFKKHGDQESVKLLGDLWVRSMGWDDKPAETKQESAK